MRPCGGPTRQPRRVVAAAAALLAALAPSGRALSAERIVLAEVFTTISS